MAVGLVNLAMKGSQKQALIFLDDRTEKIRQSNVLLDIF